VFREGSEMLYTRLNELSLMQSTSPDPIDPGEPLSSPEDRRTVYYGESGIITYFVQEVGGPVTDGVATAPSNIQCSVPATLDHQARNLGYETGLEPEEINFLKWQGALSVPEKSISDRLVQVFFECVYPAFPVFERADFAAKYNTGKLSLLTLQAVYLISATLCDEDILRRAGFKDRGAARKAFHRRAKALYDADYESDKVTIVAALLLISFCWNGSLDEKDMWHWLGSAIGLAQAQGMQRS
jgi:hypothetical protein